MKSVQLALVSAVVAIGMAAPASAATTDPEVIIYRFPGVRDDGDAPGVGVATVFHCTNFSGAAERIRFVTRTADNGIATNIAVGIDHLGTTTVSTHIAVGIGSTSLLTGAVQGTTAIAATSTNLICTAMVLDAANPKPDGVALRGIRFSPVPGSQE